MGNAFKRAVVACVIFVAIVFVLTPYFPVLPAVIIGAGGVLLHYYNT